MWSQNEAKARSLERCNVNIKTTSIFHSRNASQDFGNLPVYAN